MSNSIIMLEGSDFNGKTLKVPGVALVVAHSSRCGHCRDLMPIIKRLASVYNTKKFDSNSIKIFAVQTDDDVNKSVVSTLQSIEHFDGVPTMFIFKDKNFIGTYGGQRTETHIVNRLKNL